MTSGNPWSWSGESNPGPPPYHGGALPLSYSSGGWMIATPTRGPGSRLRGLTAMRRLSLSCSRRRRSPRAAPIIVPTARRRTHHVLGGGVLTVRIADEPDERARGLMGVKHLPADEGMAFLYGGDRRHLLDEGHADPVVDRFRRPGHRIVTIREMTPCTERPLRTYASDGPTRRRSRPRPGGSRTTAREGDRIRSFDGPSCHGPERIACSAAPSA